MRSNRWGDYSAHAVDPRGRLHVLVHHRILRHHAALTGRRASGRSNLRNVHRGPTGALSGTVRNASNSNPINGASIVAQNSIGATYNATTNGSGVYQIVSLPIGTYTVTASAGGYNASTVAGVIVTTGVTTTQNFSLTAAARPT